MINVPRIIELPSPPTQPTVELPMELRPAYERPMDPVSVDARMKEGLAFDTRRFTPRDFPELKTVRASSKPNRAGKLKRTLAIGTMAFVGAAGVVTLIGRAADGEAKFHKPYHPTPAQLHLAEVQSRINSGH